MLEFHPEFRTALGRSPIIITGAGGWLGQAALEMFSTAVPLAQIHAYGASARTYQLRNGATLPIQPLESLTRLEARNAIIFHLAFLTREHAGKMPLAAYEDANHALSATVEAFIRRQSTRGLFVPSSGAVYAPPPNPYGVLKLEDEARFATLGVPTALIRVFNLAGAFINKLDSYALACIIRDLQANRPVTLRATHPVRRGYAHVADVLNIALGLIIRGESPPVFDSWGEPIELSALAARAAAVLGKPLALQRPEWQNGAADDYLGSAIQYLNHAASLNLKPASLDQQIFETADYLGKCLAI